MAEAFHFGRAIRDLRLQRKMTGTELGQKAGMSQSKISRIETGLATDIEPAKIEELLNILDAPQTIRQRARLSVKTLSPVAQRQTYSTRFQFERALEHDRKTVFTRTFVFSTVPVPLQTLDFREAVSKHWNLTAKDARILLKTVAARQDLLWDKRRRYHFIIHEAALYSMPGSKALQIGQFDRLERLLGVSNLKIGIIPLQASLPQAGISSFVLHDERILAKETVGSDIISTDADDIALHIKTFAELERSADYGDSARALIRKAIEYFS